jgi:hypothetical protein
MRYESEYSVVTEERVLGKKWEKYRRIMKREKYWG